MIINGNIQALTGAYNVSSSSASRYTRAAADVKKGDEVTLSSEAQSFSAMLAELRGMDDARTERVDALKSEVEAGTYSVDSDKLALSLLNTRY